jgi:Predicted sugar phosphatases of the HAD superfamily
MGPAGSRGCSWIRPVDAEWRPILPQVARLAFGTLSPHLREMYGIRWNGVKETALRSTFALMRAARPLLPAKYRYIEPYNDWVRQGRRTPTLRPRGRVGERYRGLAADIDGVLAVSWEPLPGAVQARASLRAEGSRSA